MEIARHTDSFAKNSRIKPSMVHAVLPSGSFSRMVRLLREKKKSEMARANINLFATFSDLFLMHIYDMRKLPRREGTVAIRLKVCMSAGSIEPIVCY